MQFVTMRARHVESFTEDARGRPCNTRQAGRVLSSAPKHRANAD
ncbi:MAG: hypothetical protein AB7Q01_12750 [Gammaproteobacteria bacterium]